MACPLGYPFSEYQTGGALHVTMMISRSGPLHQSRLLSQAMKALSGKDSMSPGRLGVPVQVCRRMGVILCIR